MALDSSITKCPFCGNDEDYSYIVTHKYVQVRGFEDSSHDDIDRILSVDHHGACKCGKCGKIIKARE